MTAFALGTVLALLTYLSAFSAFQAGVAKLQGRGFQPPTTYADWGMQLGFKFLALIVMAVAGWVIAGRGAQLHAAGCVARSDSMGKAIGILVFCGGIGLVTLVFLNTSHYFATTVIPKPANGTGASPDYAAWAIGGLIQIILLGIMAFIGSLVTGRGVQLFLGSFSTREKSGGD
jgi:hypothetical protein